MRLVSIIRPLLSIFAALLLLSFAWWALTDGLRDVHQAATTGQHVETAIRLVCGLLSVAVVVTRLRWRRWDRPLRIAWVLTLVATVALSAVVWGPPMWHIALLFAAVALLLAWLILLALGPTLAA